MADFERCELEIRLEFGHINFDKRKNFSEGSSEPKKYAQVIRVWGAAAPRVFNSNYLFYDKLSLHFRHWASLAGMSMWQSVWL